MTSTRTQILIAAAFACAALFSTIAPAQVAEPESESLKKYGQEFKSKIGTHS